MKTKLLPCPFILQHKDENGIWYDMNEADPNRVNNVEWMNKTYDKSTWRVIQRLPHVEVWPNDTRAPLPQQWQECADCAINGQVNCPEHGYNQALDDYVFELTGNEGEDDALFVLRQFVKALQSSPSTLQARIVELEKCGDELAKAVRTMPHHSSCSSQITYNEYAECNCRKKNALIVFTNWNKLRLETELPKEGL